MDTTYHIPINLSTELLSAICRTIKCNLRRASSTMLNRQGFPNETCPPCRNDLLEAGLDISKQNQHSILFSAETFSALEEEGVKAIYEYLNPTWKNITIIAYYRRYYDWILSFHNQVAIAENPWPTFERNSTDFLVRSIVDDLNYFSLEFFLKNIFSRIMCLLIQSALETSTVFGWNHFSEEDGGFNLVRRRDIF